MMPSSIRLCIYGAGGMGRELLDIISLLKAEKGYSEIVFVTTHGNEQARIPVIKEQDVQSSDAVVIALGDGKARKSVLTRLNCSNYPTIISATALVSASANMGDGGIVADFASVNCDCIVGKFVIINSHAQISHDCRIGDFVTISPHVSCNGWVEIEDGAFIGAGAVIRNGSAQSRLVIGRNAVVGLGAVVTRSVEPGATVIGSPARRV